MLLQASDKELADLVMKLRMVSASPGRMKTLIVGDAPKRKPKTESAQKVAQRAKLTEAD